MEGAKEYEVALSFAGSERAYAAAVAEALRVAGVRTFYDEYEDEAVRLWGLDLAEEFHRIYSEASSVVVMFVSSEYRDRMWTRHERRSAIERALRERREYILPVQFDATQLPGISANIGYLASSAVTPEQLAERIQQKIVAIGGRIPARSGATSGWLADGANRVPGTTTVQVLDARESPIVGAQVALVRANETASFASTDTGGTASIMLPGREMVTAWIAHPDFRAGVVDSHDSASDLTVRLIQKPGYSSHIFETSTGYLPDFEGRLNPISDGARRYFYGDNIAANGTAANPALVELDVPLAVEDRQGRRRLLTFRGLTGHQSLLEVATHSA